MNTIFDAIIAFLCSAVFLVMTISFSLIGVSLLNVNTLISMEGLTLLLIIGSIIYIPFDMILEHTD